MVIGEGKCCVCWGSCCPLVNCAINTLVRVGELNEDAEVSVMCYCVHKLVLYRAFVMHSLLSR